MKFQVRLWDGYDWMIREECYIDAIKWISEYFQEANEERAQKLRPATTDASTPEYEKRTGS
jgi:hypothetical protein